MRVGLSAALALVLCVSATAIKAQESTPAATPAAAAAPVPAPAAGQYRTVYLRLNRDTEALLYEPLDPGPKARIALVSAHPDRDTFNEPFAPELAKRGYRVLTINYLGEGTAVEAMPEAYLPSISLGIAYLRKLAGVEKVVMIEHSGGGHLGALYANVAAHGPSACDGPEKIYPCKPDGLTGLQKPDGFIFLDSTLGALHPMSGVDPSVKPFGNSWARTPSLDMFAPANGYDLSARKASYPAAFVTRFYRAQTVENTLILNYVLGRLKLISAGKGRFSDDEPLVIRGMGFDAAGARLYQADTTLAAHTKDPHILLRADGTDARTIVNSVRPPIGQQVVNQIHALNPLNQETTVRHFLASSAIRTNLDYGFSADDITGVDWKSAYTSTPSNAEGITVPTLVMTMSCHYLVVPGEVIFNHLAAQDKTYAGVEGATHDFGPCRPEYGDTTKRTFDFVASWLAKDGRF